MNTLLGVKYFLAKEPYDNPDFELIGIAYDNYYYMRRDPFPRAWIASEIVSESNDQAVRDHLLDPNMNSLQTVYVDGAVDLSGGGEGHGDDHQVQREHGHHHDGRRRRSVGP